jgi:argininosuccinate lyase
MTLWGGRFTSATSDAMSALSRSVHFDWRLAPYDIVSSKSHCQNLVKSKTLTAAEGKKIMVALDQLRKDIERGAVTPTEQDEDLHGVIERVLIDRLGELGGKLRAGRSRNDQIATDLRLYLRDVSCELIAQIISLAQAFTVQAKRHENSYVSGFTHLQHAQPIVFGHELAKHAHALLRDVERLEQWWERTGVSPLGSGALAGTALSANPEGAAKNLGFGAAAGNSIDAVSDRDFAAEFLFIAAMIGIHLSRIGEEWILWSASEFGWAKLSDSFSTGSSIMPQKKNPDVAELARGKSGRLVGNLTSLLVTLKGLPFAYNRDLQEDKEPVFDSIDTLLLLLPAVIGMVETTEFDSKKMASGATTGFALATEIADYLVRKGVPFSKAHDISGRAVTMAEAKGITLEELSLAEYQSLNKLFNADIFKALTVESAVASRKSRGGTAPAALRIQLTELGTLISVAKRANSKRSAHMAKLWGESSARKARKVSKQGSARG